MDDSEELGDLDYDVSSEDGSLGISADSSPGIKPSAGPGIKPRASPGTKRSPSPATRPSASPAASSPKAPPVDPPPKFLRSIQPHRLNLEVMEKIKEETDVQAMRDLLLRNFNKISGYDYLMGVLCDITKYYGRPEVSHFEISSDCYLVVSEVARIVDTLHKNWAVFDIPLKNQALLKGSALEKMIDLSKDKLSQLLRSMERKALVFEEQMSLVETENRDLQQHIQKLEEHLENANRFIQHLRGERFHDDAPSEQDFMADLQMELSMREFLNSSLQEQNYKLRKSNERYAEELVAVQANIAGQYRKHLDEIAKLCKDMELEEGIRKEVVEKIKEITDNEDQIVEAVNDWMKTINRVIGERQTEINEKTKKAKTLSDGIAMREVEIIDMEDRNKETIRKIESLREETKKLAAEERYYSAAHASQRKRNEQLEHEAASGSEVTSVGLSPFVGPRAAERPRHWRPPRFDPARSKLLPLYEEMEDSFDSPEHHRKDSPEYQKTQAMEDSLRSLGATPPESPSSPFSDSGPHSLHYDTSSPRSPYSPHSDSRSPGSPYSPHYDTHSPQSSYSPHSDTRSLQSPYSPYSDTSSPQSPRKTIAPGTQTFSRSPSEFAPTIRHIDPSTQPMGFMNRIDVGESFNMQAVHSGSPTPYSQDIRVTSTIPEEGPGRMVDAPFNVMHKAEITPDPSYVTPFISKSRFGYTDPTAKVLNLPPGREFDVPTGMKKTVILTSPKRKEPLLVDIGIHPKPLTETESGEHFVCDISLAVQQPNKRRHIPDRVRFKHLSPVITFDEPPAVTPTTDRRHGLHTPRGIFQRKHYNVRRVHRPDEYQSPNLPWSPQDLPDDGSPISRLYPSPNITDTSISWEKGPESPYSAIDSPMNRTFDAPPRSALNRTYEISPSPVIKGPSYGRPSSESDTYSSSSPVIKGRYYYSGTPESDYSSPSPIIKGPSWMRRSQGQDLSSDRSQSPQLDRTYDMSLSGTRSFSSRSPSPGFDRTFDSHGMNFGHDQSSENHHGYIGSTPSYSSQSRSGSPKYDSSFDGPSSGTYDRRSPSQGNQTFSRTPSPRMNQTFGRIPPSQGNQMFDRTSPQFDESFEESLLGSGFYEEEYSPEFRAY